ncbi:unnamed protein product [Cyclocybe aegerita]|uniref:Kelch repeat protein n=1 Tax=Cyclocybe aegerita TaxID=1973307 RepID=A0A8S0W5E9_CYCAE|nr:unnamed protein product [Cyclocybe aegerita]
MPTGAARVRGLNAAPLHGDLQKFTELCQTTEDPRRRKLYVYGGMHPKDFKRNIPSNDFYVCDMDKMEFTNLTDSLTYAVPGDPFAVAACWRKTKRLPALGEPGIAFAEISGIPVVFLFGGHDLDRDVPSSKLIAVNTLHLEWFYVDFEPVQKPRMVAPRLKPAMVAYNEKLYIFGGVPSYDEPRKQAYHRSYSIAAFQPGKLKWKWIAADEPYPNELQQNFRSGVMVHGGQAILLAPGKVFRDSERVIDFTSKSLYYFIPRKNIFERLRDTGVQLPRDVHWYYLRAYDPDALQKDAVYNPTTPSAILCTWVPDIEHPRDYLTVEGWRLFLPPDQPERMECFNMKTEVSKLDLDLQRFTLVGKRMFLMGSGGEKVNGEAMCDTYVEFSVDE